MRTFWRLLGFLRPYRTGVAVSFVLAAFAMGAGVLIPYLIGRTVDEIENGGVDLRPLALAVAAAGVFRLLFSVSRRLVAGKVSLGVEYDLRNGMYKHLHSLELEFFDGQQTGQLMSRSTVDLQSVRFFLGYGLIFIVQSALTILIAAAVMLAVDPVLAAVALAPTPFVIWVAFRYGRRNRPASQEVQQRIAELTAEAEENVGGVRVVKAFAQEERQLRRFSRAVARVFDQSMVSTRLRAFYSPFIGFLRQGIRPGRGAVRGRAPSHQRQSRGRPVRGLLRLRPAAHLTHADARHRASGWPSAPWPAARACSRSSTVSRSSPRRRARRPCRPAEAASSCAASASATTAGSPSCMTWT